MLPAWFAFTSLWISSTVTNGMSQARNKTASAPLVLNAVHTPPNGPQRGTRSRRITRTGQVVWPAMARMRDKRD